MNLNDRQSLMADCEAEAVTAYQIAVFGSELAKRHGYDADGLQAIWVHLIEKHHWLPSVVRSMSVSDLSLALTQDMKGWALPAATPFGPRENNGKPHG